MRSIHLQTHNIKAKVRDMLEIGLREWGITALVLLVALASFGLGRLSAFEEARPLISVGEAPQASQVRALPLGGQFVASRTGTVYYFPWCGGAQQIPVGDQLWFASENVAQKAGYNPAKNCKGLHSE